MGIPSIDLSVLVGAPSQRRTEVLGAFLRSCASHGFVKVVGHGISDIRLRQLFAWTREFFDFPDSVKRTAARASRGPYRGYAAVGEEQIAAISGYMKGIRDSTGVKDFKESFDLGPRHDKMYPTPWPRGPQCEEFKDFMQSFFEECLLLHHQILLILEEALNLPNNELVSLCAEGNGEVRITHYPSIPVAQLKTGSTCRIAEHTDIGILTLLFQDTVGGLEVEDQNHPSLFLPVESKNPGEMILNVGDTLQRWTRNSLLSANHRVTYRQALKDNEVILPPRYSVGFFGKADAAASMKPLAQFLSAEENELMMEGDGRRAQEYYNFMHERTIATTSNL